MNYTTFQRCKKLMIFFNVIFLLSGVTLLAGGIWIAVDVDSFIALLNFNSLLFVYASYVAITVGGITIIISFCGCVGAWKESKCLLIVFNIVLLLFLLAEIGALILAFVFTSDIENVLGTAALASIRTHYGVSSPIGWTATKVWDFTQITFGCCGYINGTDYLGSVYDSGAFTIHPWPLTCCVRNGAGGYVDVTACLTSTTLSPQISNAALGCHQHLTSQISTYSLAVGCLTGAVVVIQLLAIGFATFIITGITEFGKIAAW